MSPRLRAKWKNSPRRIHGSGSTVYDASRRISESPRLKDYGTAEAQEYLKKWAKEFAPKEDKPVDEDNPVKARAVEPSANGANDQEESRSEDSAVQDE